MIRLLGFICYMLFLVAFGLFSTLFTSPKHKGH
jgi:hypothetical protein